MERKKGGEAPGTSPVGSSELLHEKILRDFPLHLSEEQMLQKIEFVGRSGESWESAEWWKDPRRRGNWKDCNDNWDWSEERERIEWEGQLIGGSTFGDSSTKRGRRNVEDTGGVFGYVTSFSPFPMKSPQSSSFRFRRCYSSRFTGEPRRESVYYIGRHCKSLSIWSSSSLYALHLSAFSSFHIGWLCALFKTISLVKWVSFPLQSAIYLTSQARFYRMFITEEIVCSIPILEVSLLSYSKGKSDWQALCSFVTLITLTIIFILYSCVREFVNLMIHPLILPIREHDSTNLLGIEQLSERFWSSFSSLSFL